jgi:UDP-4-amino-4,6-dideoxy-N-acetyl-beta-L-altrosamine N-acetyltransferase
MAQDPNATIHLRPVTTSDAHRIIELRANEARASFLNQVTEDLAVQEVWIESDLQDPSTGYFAVVRGGSVAGFIGYNNLDTVMRQAEWGRWIMEESSPGAVTSVLLLLKHCFEELGLTRLYCRTVADNAKSLRFHDRLGLRQSGTLPRHFCVRGVSVDAVEHEVTAEYWPEICARLERLSRGCTL